MCRYYLKYSCGSVIVSCKSSHNSTNYRVMVEVIATAIVVTVRRVLEDIVEVIAGVVVVKFRSFI